MAIVLDKNHEEELIRVYAENSVAGLDIKPALIKIIFNAVEGVDSFSDIEKVVIGYKEFVNHLRKIKSSLEDIVGLFSSPVSQARYCLIQLSDRANEDDEIKMKIFTKLVDYLFIKNLWAAFPAVIKQYKDTADIIQTWNHFFVSYTTKDTPGINNLYNPELANQFDPDIVKKELVGNNLIAKYIVKCLKKYNNLKVFFDRESIVCGDIIKEEVYEYCEKTFSFIQLIEDISFSKEKGITNWCYSEYDRFSSFNAGNKKTKHFFVIDGFDIDPAIVPPSYLLWAQDIVTTKYEKISRPFDVISIKKKCQEFTKHIKEARSTHISELIKAVA